jgi:hypothetical protein
MKKELIVVCLVIILLLLGYNLYIRIIETFEDEKYNPHNCPPLTVNNDPFYSHMSPSKGWCTSNSYAQMPVKDEQPEFNKSPNKCPMDYSRVSGAESINSESKSFCKKPKVY